MGDSGPPSPTERYETVGVCFLVGTRSRSSRSQHVISQRDLSFNTSFLPFTRVPGRVELLQIYLVRNCLSGSGCAGLPLEYCTSSFLPT